MRAKGVKLVGRAREAAPHARAPRGDGLTGGDRGFCGVAVPAAVFNAIPVGDGPATGISSKTRWRGMFGGSSKGKETKPRRATKEDGGAAWA